MQKKILIIDDDPVQTKLLETKLPENGYLFLSATKAAVGLQMAINKHPDLIILDVMMPIINGYNLCQLLKNDPTHKNIPIILLTSRDKEKDIEIGRNVGADAYLIKPVSISSLLEKIKELLKN
ncbi:MAG: response regulator [Candidatus Aceula lacicola]|nr:response regulator [Candidatus Aceula lacicola]